MTRKVLISTTGNGIVRASQHNGGWDVHALLEGHDVRCLAVDPLNMDRVYAGTSG